MPVRGSLPVLHLGDDLAARSADGLELVECGINTVTSEAAFTEDGGRLVDERALDETSHVGQVVELGKQAAHERSLDSIEKQLDARHRVERLPERHEIARPCRSQRDAADQPFQVVHALERVAKLASLGRAERQFLDGIEPVTNALERTERTKQPCPEQPPTHRGDGAIDLVQERALRTTFAACQHFQMLQGDLGR